MSLVAKIQAWARKDTHGEKDYSPVGQLFHWSMAALVTVQLWWGWWIGRLPVGSDKLQAYQMHSRLGLLILVLVLLRMVWRLAVPGPVNDADKPGWQSLAAHAIHYAFYVALVGLPLSGWAMWSSMASEQPLSVAGVAPWPQLPLEGLPRATRWTIMQWSETVHLALVWALLIMIPLHVGAALKHHFWDRDDVLAGMTPLLEPLPKRRSQGVTPAAQPHRPTRPESRTRSEVG